MLLFLVEVETHCLWNLYFKEMNIACSFRSWRKSFELQINFTLIFIYSSFQAVFARGKSGRTTINLNIVLQLFWGKERLPTQCCYLENHPHRHDHHGRRTKPGTREDGVILYKNVALNGHPTSKMFISITALLER